MTDFEILDTSEVSQRRRNYLLWAVLFFQLIIVGMLVFLFVVASKIDYSQIREGLELLSKSEKLFTFIHKVDSCINRLHICKQFEDF